MEIGRVGEQLRGVAELCSTSSPTVSDVQAGLADIRCIRSWIDAAEALLAIEVARSSSFPEAAIADVSRGTLGNAGKTLDRARTLDDAPAFAESLADGSVTAGHVDVMTRAATTLDADQRERLLGRCESLIDVAEHATTAQWDRRVRDEARRIAAESEMETLERQRRATSLRSWVDAEGMWNLRGRFDPLTGVRIDARLRAVVDTLFAESAPATCPSDPIEKQHHLRALALDQLVEGSAAGVRPGRSEILAVIDVGPVGTTDGSVRNDHRIDWSIPVEIPALVLADLAGTADVTAVVVCNGVVLHAPGALDLGRTSRVANRAQRRALRGLYVTCGIPGCAVHYDRCQLHHVIWWRHGGRTDLGNLIPLCTHHHHRVHDDGWQLELGPNRELTVRFPDGSVRSTGPPSRRAVA
jgi:hypothetical protein